VQHVFLGEAVPDPEAVKRFVRKVCENYRLPYFTLSPTFSICPEHGYLRGEIPKCSECDRETEVYSRIVGYLRPVNQWNDGKQTEFAARSTYRIHENGGAS
jgi:ribonucleoside-triphosphate reductase